MKGIIKNLGLFVILLGVIFLGIVVFTKQQTNTQLLISLILIIGGLFAHILIGKLEN